MVITTFIDLTRTTMVYRLAYMKKSGNRLSRCPDFVIHYIYTFDDIYAQISGNFLSGPGQRLYRYKVISCRVKTAFIYRNNHWCGYRLPTKRVVGLSIYKALQCTRVR